jgi:hypothetical protein
VSAHPANGAARFALELAALAAMGRWGFSLGTGALRWAFALGLPTLAAVLWGVFAVPDDPSRSGKTVIATPGWARLALEFAFFGTAAVALRQTGLPAWALGYAIAVVAHYAVSYDRVAWLLRRPSAARH